MTNPVLAYNTEHGRHYKHPGSHREVPSITNITGMKFKPLFKAGMREAAHYAAEIRDKLGALDEEQVYTLVANAPQRADSPRAIGDIVHNLIDQYVKRSLAGTLLERTEPLPEDTPQTAKWMFQRFLNFVNYYKTKFPDFEFTASEFTVWSNRYGYAGTADMSFRMNGRHVLADTKSGKAVYPDVAMQLAALSKADVVLSADGTEVPVPKYDGYAALHLRPRSWSLHPIDHIDEAFEAFLALKRVFDWDVQYAGKTVVLAPKMN